MLSLGCAFDRVTAADGPSTFSHRSGKRKFLPVVVLVLALALSYAPALALSPCGTTVCPPATLAATTYSKSQINVAWDDPNPGVSGAEEAGYIVERSKGTTTSWSKVFTSGPDVTSWSSTGLSTGTLYYFRVRAFVVVGGTTTYSDYSPVASATTQSSLYPNPARSLTASTLSATQIGLKWQDKANNESGYEIQRAPSSSGPWNLVGTVGANQVSYTDSGLSPNTPYSYQVLAFNSTGESPPSNVASATTKPDQTAPTVYFVSPSAGTTYTSAQVVTITAWASDNVAVSRVEFWDGGVLLGTATASPYAYAWSITSADNRLHQWTAKAYDTSNNVATSTALSLTVDIASSDTTPPAPGPVTISGTQSGSFVSSSFGLTATFTDNESAVIGCQYTTDGSTWLAATVSGTGPTYTCTKTGLTGTNGQPLTLNMRGTSSGGTAVAAALTRTVDAAAPSTTSNAATVWVASDQTVTLTPSDGSGSGVASTQYCIDTTNSCTPATSGTSVGVTCAAGSACQTYVRFRSTDQIGNLETTNSALVRIDKGSPSVTITAPAGSQSTSTSSSPLVLGGSASDNIGVTSVTWSNASTGGSGPASGTTSWSASVPLNPGDNVITVMAKDVANNSATATITVSYTTADTTPPIPGTVTIGSAQFGSFVSSSFSLTTSFTDNESGVTGCQYTTDGSTWLAATVSGTGPTYTCTKTGLAGTNGQTLTLNMRGTSSGGTAAAAALTRTVDAAAPNTTSNAVTGWVATDQTVTLAASDGSGAGVASTQYCTDTTNACTPATGGTSVGVTCAAGSACQTYLRFRSTDQVANVEVTDSALVRIDKAAPSNGTLSASPGDSLITLNWSGFADSGSGLSSAPYALFSSTAGSPSCSGTPLYSGSSTSFAHSGLTNGTTYYYRLCATDAVGNVSTGATASATAASSGSDTAPPVGSMAINGGATYTNSLAVTLTLSATDNVGVTGYWVSLSTTTPLATAVGWTAVTATPSYNASVPYTIAFTTDATRTIYVWFKDAAGNVSAMTSDSIVVDRTPPSVAITAPTTASTWSATTSTVALGGTASDLSSGVASVTWSNAATGGNGTASGTTSWSASVPLTAGDNVITVTAKDKANNSATATITVSYSGGGGDTTPPVPGAVTASNTQFGSFVSSPFTLTASFTDNESAVTGCAYTTDGSTWLAASLSGSSPTFTCTKSGISGSNGQSLTLNMRATSGGGTAAAAAIIRTVDAAAPTTTGNAATAWVSADQTVTLTASDSSGSGVASTQYCTDTTNSCTPATSGTSVSVTCAAGNTCQTYVRFRSADQVGNLEATKSALVRIDKDAPTTTSNAAAAWVAADQTVTLTASDSSGSGVASTQYCTDTSNACTPATSGTSVSVTCAAGSACQTYVRFRSTDQTGNVEATNSALVRIDKAVPAVAITTPTTASTWNASSSPLALGGTASDAGSGVTSVSWSNAATGGNGAASGTTSWSASVPLAAGSNVITVTAKDAANNSSTTDTLTVTYTAPDTTPPVPGTLTTASTQFGNFISNPFTLTTTFTDNESAVTSCQYTTDGSTWLAATLSGSSPTFTCTQSGISGTNGQSFTLNMRATSSGGTGTASAVTRTIDSAAPTTTSNAATAWVAADQTVTLTASDGSGAGVASTQYCTDTSNSCTPATSGTSVSVTCAAGSTCQTYVRFRSTDQIGNVEATNSALVRIDKAAPSNGTLTATPGDTQVALSWSGFADSGSGLSSTPYRIYSSTGGLPACTGTPVYSGSAASYTQAGLTNGTTYYYRACATDAVGNVSTGATASATPGSSGPDTAPPAGSVVINSGASYTNSLTVTLNLSATDNVGVTGYWASLSSSTPLATATGWTAVTATPTYNANVSYTIAFTADATRTIYVWFKDAAGNVSAMTSDSIIVDRTPPTNGTLTATAGINNVSLRWSGFSDGGSGLASTNTYTLVYATDATPASCAAGTTLLRTTTTSFTHSGLTAGTTYYYRVCATDAAGNVDTGAIASTTALANQPPVAKPGPAQTGTVGTMIYFDGSGSYDSDGFIVSYTFDFGDGFNVSSSDVTLASHAYSMAGTYTMTLTVTDNLGATSSAGTQVTVRSATLATGNLSWVKQLGGPNGDVAYTTTVDGNGNVIVAGSFQGTVDFGGHTLTSTAGTSDIFVAKYSPTGAYLWAIQKGSSGDDRANAVAVDSSGNVFVTGYFQGTVDFGGGALVSNGGSSDVFVAKYSSTGAYQWALSFGDSTDDMGYGIATDKNGNVVVTGYFRGRADFGGGYVSGSAGSPDVFVAKYAGTDGTYLWANTLIGIASDMGHAVAVDSDGNVVLAGSFQWSVQDGATLTPLMTSAGNSDVFVIKFSPAGSYLWTRAFGGPGDDVAYGVAVDSGGNIVVAGYFSGTVSFGGTALVAAGSWDVFLAKYSPLGNHLWSQGFGGTGIDSDFAVAVDGVGSIVMTGAFQGTASFGGTSLTSAGQWDILVAKYSAAGARLWVKGFGSTGNDVGSGVIVDSAGNALVTGYFEGTVNFAGSALTSAGGVDAFLLKLAP